MTWKPGQSGNPLGKSKNPFVAERIMELTHDGRDLVAIEVSIAKGEPQYIPQQVRLPDGSYAELESDSPRVLIPDLGDRERARVRLMDRVYGKTPERVEHTDREGQPLFDPRSMPVETLEAYSIALKTLIDRAQEVDAVVVESPRLPPGKPK